MARVNCAAFVPLSLVGNEVVIRPCENETSAWIVHLFGDNYWGTVYGLCAAHLALFSEDKLAERMAAGLQTFSKEDIVQ